MTHEKLEAIRKRAEKATKGPWERLNGVDVFTPLNTTNNHGVTSDYNDGWHIATCDGFNTSVNGEESELDFAEIKANADFIANAREDIPALLAEVDRLQKELESIAKSINDYYENEEDDIPVNDLLDAIMEDAYEAIGGDA